MSPVTGFTAACGNVLLRKDEGFVLLTVKPRSPLMPVVTKLATVVAAPTLLPPSVDMACWMDAGLPNPPLSQNTCTAWSVPTTTLLPCTRPLATEMGPDQLLPPFPDF